MFRASLVSAILATAAFAGQAAAQSWTTEIYGGGTFERHEDYGGASLPLDAGTAFGAGIYNESFFPGVELGFDLMHSKAGYKGDDTELSATSLMLNARMPFALGKSTIAYVGAGLGAINVDYDGGTTAPGASGNDTVAGGQVGIGLRYDLASMSTFVELKHQMALDDASIQGADQSFEATSAVVGLRFAF